VTAPLLTRFLTPAGDPLTHFAQVLVAAQRVAGEPPSEREELADWSLDRVAVLLAADSVLCPASVRARISEDLQLEMSRVPIDARALARDLATEPAVLRAKIEGDRPLSLAEYARIRTVLADHRERP
jgi:hypothetical protein